MMPPSFLPARRHASGITATLSLLALLALVPPVWATVKTVSVAPPAPASCDSVTITVAGDIPNSCYEVSTAEIRGPEYLPCARPLPCPARFRVEITVREPNPVIARSCLAVVSPYTRSFQVGRLFPGPYDVVAHERVIPFSADSTDSVVAESYAMGAFTVGPDSSCAGSLGCFLLTLVPDLPDGRFPVDPSLCTASALPGGTACLGLALTNSRTVGGLQVTMDVSGRASSATPDGILHPVSVEAIGRAAGFQVGWSAVGSRAKFLLYSTSGASIPAGYGPVVRICYSIAPGAVSQILEVSPTAAIAADPAGDSIPPCPTFAIPLGEICIGTRACDVNGDGTSDVLDIIRLVRCALANPADSLPACPDSIAARTDCNGDGAVDIRDVICCVRKIVELPSGLGEVIPSLTPRSGTIPAGVNSISFEGTPRWINAVDGIATVRIETAENWGGTQFVINPMGALSVRSFTSPVRIRGLSLDAASVRAGSEFESAIDGSGIAHALLVQTAADARPAHTYRVLVRLERAPSDAGPGTVRIQGVKAGTSEGFAADISLFNPSIAVDPEAPGAPALLAAHPNPTSGQTEIGFTLPADGRATLRVYDVAGRLVRTLAEGPMTSGIHRASWNGRDDRGRTARSGIYFAKLQVGKTLRSERILLLR